MKSIPIQLTIRGIDYTIKHQKNLNLEDVGVMGVLDGDNGVIVLEADAPLKMQWRTLLHEATHAILRGHDAGDDEFLVDVIAGEIYNLLKQIGAIS